LADFFGPDDVFFAYGNERVGNDDFELDIEEGKVIRGSRKTLRSSGTRNGPKPKLPVKSHNDTFVYIDESALNGISPNSLPIDLQNRYTLGPIIGELTKGLYILVDFCLTSCFSLPLSFAGDGNFAVVLKIKDKSTKADYALKIIDKSKCPGKVSWQRDNIFRPLK
jgi:doublecortin-like kinase 1/2